MWLWRWRCFVFKVWREARTKPNSILLPPTTFSAWTRRRRRQKCCSRRERCQGSSRRFISSSSPSAPLLWHLLQDLPILSLMPAGVNHLSIVGGGRACPRNGSCQRTPVRRGGGCDMREPGGCWWECERDRRRCKSRSGSQHVEQQTERARKRLARECRRIFIWGVA